MLPLLPILRNLPPMQLTGDAASVPAEARLELPFSLIEPQLATGRISVTAKVFEVSLPAEYRSLFQAGAGAVDVSLPLQEVLKNLPAASLRMRDDQVEQEAGQNFATPFSAKAEEDAKTLNVPLTPIAKPVVAPVPVEASLPAVAEPVAASVSPAVEPRIAEPVAAPEAYARPATAPEGEKGFDRPLRSPLQVALDTDEKLDAKAVVALVNKIPGVKSCAILFGDGLSLAGSLPAELETEGICAMAPSLMQRIENHLVDTKLGALRGMTLSCVKGAITFYMHENLCLARAPCRRRLCPEKPARSWAASCTSFPENILTPFRVLSPCRSSITPAERSSSRSSITVLRCVARRRISATSTSGLIRRTGAISSRSRPRPTALCSSIFCRLNAVVIKGFVTKFQLYTVPGQVIYNATRQLVLRSVDGVIFVADSQWEKMEENVESFKNLEDNLAKQNISIDEIPYVLQYNKRDLENVAPVNYLEYVLNNRKKRVQSFEVVSSTGQNVFASLNAVSQILLHKFSKQSDVPKTAPPPVAIPVEPVAKKAGAAV